MGKINNENKCTVRLFTDGTVGLETPDGYVFYEDGKYWTDGDLQLTLQEIISTYKED